LPGTPWQRAAAAAAAGAYITHADCYHSMGPATSFSLIKRSSSSVDLFDLAVPIEHQYEQRLQLFFDYIAMDYINLDTVIMHNVELLI
jgi:hypothetical protein